MVFSSEFAIKCKTMQPGFDLHISVLSERNPGPARFAMSSDRSHRTKAIINSHLLEGGCCSCLGSFCSCKRCRAAQNSNACLPTEMCFQKEQDVLKQTRCECLNLSRPHLYVRFPWMFFRVSSCILDLVLCRIPGCLLTLYMHYDGWKIWASSGEKKVAGKETCPDQAPYIYLFYLRQYLHAAFWS